MSASLTLALVFLGGMLAGGAYFGGLMLTVRRARSARNPGMLFLASFTVRTGCVLPLFVALGGARWERYAACLLGFLAARGIAAFLWGPRREERNEVKAWRS